LEIDVECPRRKRFDRGLEIFRAGVVALQEERFNRSVFEHVLEDDNESAQVIALRPAMDNRFQRVCITPRIEPANERRRRGHHRADQTFD
jgi:hypothetical protein